MAIEHNIREPFKNEVFVPSLTVGAWKIPILEMISIK